MKEIPRNIPTGTGTFGLHSGQKGGKRPLSAAAGRQMEKPAGQWEWPTGRSGRRSNRQRRRRPAGQPVETGGPGRRRVGVGGEELPRGRREGAADGATSGTAGRRRRGGTPERPAGRSDRRGNRQRRAVPEGGGSAAGRRRVGGGSAAGQRRVSGRRQKRHPGAALRGVDGQAVFNTILMILKY